MVECFLFTLSIGAVKLNCQNFTYLERPFLKYFKGHFFRKTEKLYMIYNLKGAAVWMDFRWFSHLI